MNDILVYTKKIAAFLGWKFFTLLYSPFVLLHYIRYKRNPIQENHTKYILKRNWWIENLRV